MALEATEMQETMTETVGGEGFLGNGAVGYGGGTETGGTMGTGVALVRIRRRQNALLPCQGDGGGIGALKAIKGQETVPGQCVALRTIGPGLQEIVPGAAGPKVTNNTRDVLIRKKKTTDGVAAVIVGT